VSFYLRSDGDYRLCHCVAKEKSSSRYNS
jgi:hypothetical protein